MVLILKQLACLVYFVVYLFNALLFIPMHCESLAGEFNKLFASCQTCMSCCFVICHFCHTLLFIAMQCGYQEMNSVSFHLYVKHSCLVHFLVRFCWSVLLISMHGGLLGGEYCEFFILKSILPFLLNLLFVFTILYCFLNTLWITRW